MLNTPDNILDSDKLRMYAEEIVNILKLESILCLLKLLSAMNRMLDIFIGIVFSYNANVFLYTV